MKCHTLVASHVYYAYFSFRSWGRKYHFVDPVFELKFCNSDGMLMERKWADAIDKKIEKDKKICSLSSIRVES